MKNLKNTTALLAALLTAGFLFGPGADAQDSPYPPADLGERPRGGTRVLPEKFLRGYDPVTVYFAGNVGPGRGPADDGARFLKVSPAWPGAWEWLDKKTLQFRPAEPWPALRRFSFSARGAEAVLTTMMSSPSSMSPTPGSEDLRPFRSLTLTFPQSLPLVALEQMLTLEVRDLPGLSDAKTSVVEDFSVRPLPRRSHRDAAVYSVTLKDPVPEGKQLVVKLSLALGDEGKTLWQGRVSTRPEFHLERVVCGSDQFPLAGGGDVPREMALDCGQHGERPQLVFSANVAGLTLTTLKKLVRFEPAVEDLNFQVFGSRVQLKGKFVPDVLYRMRVGPAPVQDDAGRRLVLSGGGQDVYFYLGWKQPFLRWRQGRAIVENEGPRMVPLVGYGEPRADLRIYRIDPDHRGLWPFPSSPVVLDEEQPPPFPGEEPAVPGETQTVSAGQLYQHIRLLGSPLVSRIVDLPLTQRSGTTTFGLDLGGALDDALGARKPGHYLVGLRRLTGQPNRSYMRVQITDLALTTVEEREQAVFYVRSLSTAEPVRGALLTLEAVRPGPKDAKGYRPPVVERLELRTDTDGRAVVPARPEWTGVRRVMVTKGDDVLILDPRDPPPMFANNHWSPASHWLHWLTEEPPPAPGDDLRAFVFTERPIYKPGETVYVKGFVRLEKGGALTDPGDTGRFQARVEGPGGQRYPMKLTWSPLKGFDGSFQEKDAPTGSFQVVLVEKLPRRSERVLARRQFSIEAYRTPKFEVQLSGPLTARLDEPFKVRAAARYYAGGKVAGQDVRWTVTQRPYHYVPKGREGFLFASSSQFARSTSRRGADAIERNARLDDNGGDSIEVNPALDIDGSPRVYRFEATVTGADNQRVSATTEVRGLPPFVLGMKLDRYLKQATEVVPEIIAVGPDDELSAGEKVTVKLYRRVWHSHLRETDFATGKASYVTEQEDQKVFETQVTTTKQGVKAKLPVKRAGVYIVELVARDKLGRVQSLTADLYVGGDEPVSWKKSQHGVFELATDKVDYKPGEVANLIIKSPYTTGKALVIVEKPRGNQYSWVDIENGSATRPIRIDGRDVPNLPVHVIVMRGRVGGGAKDKGATDERYRPQTVAASHTLKVRASENLVKVDVQHPEVAQPGQTVDFTVSLKDDDDRPIAGEVTLWLVDEAVLALRKEGNLDPLQTFITPNPSGTSVRDTRNTVIGRLVEEEETPGGDGYEEDMAMEARRSMMSGKMKKKTRVRKNFKSVPFFKATLTVGPSGTVKIPVALSDDLTNFQIRAVAASGLTRFGVDKSKIRVRLPVIVQPQLPRFVRQGDRFDAGGVARLVEGKEGKGTVSMTVQGPISGAIKPRALDLKLDKANSVTWPVTVGGQAGAGELTFGMEVRRQSDGASDAFEVKLPVLPDQREERFAYFDTFKPGKVKLKDFPEPARAGTATQEVTVTRLKGLMEVMAGVDYLVRYPHGCLEQKMSQLTPQIALAELVGRLGGRPLYPEVKQVVTAFLEDMALHQDDRGLFGYWPGAQGDVQLTAQALEFLHLVTKLGVSPEPTLRSRAEGALKRALRSDYPGLISDYRFNQQSAALAALTRTGQGDEHYLVELFHRRDKFDTSSLADLASAMGRTPKPFGKNLDQLKEQLWDRVAFKLYQGKKVYSGLQDSRRWGGYYLGSSTATLAAVLESLSTIDSSNSDLTLLREALLAKAHPTRGFGSTYDNRRAIQALLVYFDKAREDGGVVTVDLTKAKLNLTSAQKLDRAAFAHHRPVTATVKGGEAYARVAYTYLPEKPGDRLPARNQGLIVKRSQTHYAGKSSPTRLDDQRGAERELKIGDILELHTELTLQEDRSHIALIVPFAAGLEPLNPELATSGKDAQPAERDTARPTYVQRLDHENRYYFDRLSKGTYKVHFRVRATTKGSYTHPGPWAELMYEQEVRGRGAGMRVIVE